MVNKGFLPLWSWNMMLWRCPICSLHRLVSAHTGESPDPPCVLVYSYASWPLAGIFWTADVCLTAGLCGVELRQSLGRPLFLICNPPHMHFASVSFLITETGSNLRQEGFILDCGFKGYGLSWQRRPGSVETHGSRHRGNSLPTLPQTRK